MSARIGIGIARDTVRILVMNGNGVAWAAEAALPSDRGLDDILAAAVSEAKVPTWPRPVVSAAVGPHGSQVKLISGLPELDDAEMLAAVIRESSGTFFLRNGTPPVTTGVRVTAAGTVWAAAIDRHWVDALRDVCRARHWRLGLIAPTAVALPLVIEDERFTWRDGNVLLEITHSARALRSVRARVVGAVDQPASPCRVGPDLSVLGEKALQYADAYGAIGLRVDESLALDATAAGWWTGAQVRRRFVGPLLVLAVGIVSVALSPLGARLAERRALGQVQRVRPDQWKTIDSAVAQLEQVTDILERISRFAEGPRVSTVLGGLARALPDGSAIARIELSANGGEALVLTPEAGPVLAALRGLPGLVSAQLQPVTGAAANGPGPLQRVLIRFGEPDSPAQPPAAGPTR